MKNKIIILSCLLILGVSCKKEPGNQAPVAKDQTFSIDENSAQGTEVGQVIALDPDSDQPLTYSIVGGNTDEAFAISAQDGKITVQNEDAVDYETNPVFTLQVEVKDDNNAITDTNITINLNNIVIPTKGQILYMPFDGNVKDLSGNQNDGIDSTSDNFVAGVRSEALDFNGTSDYIQLSDTINAQNGLSFSFWIKTRGANGTENNGAIVSKYSMASNSRSFMIFSFGAYETRDDNRLSAVFYKYGTMTEYRDLVKSYLDSSELAGLSDPTLWTLSNPKKLPLDTWTHCVVNVTDTTIETWINGKLCIKKQREYQQYFDNDEPIYIGNNMSSGQGSNNHFNGILDELRIYNRGLTEEEIKTLFKE